MALDLYSKATTDTLLAAKLDLAGGTMTGGLTLSASGIIFSDATYLTTAPAGSTLAADQLTAGVVTANPTAGPTASGDVLQYDGTNLVWGSGGGGGAVAADQLTAGVVTANPTAGPTASGDVLQYDGTNLVWGPGGGGGGAVWGGITGTVTDQTDLTLYLGSNYYPLSGNPSGFITSVPAKSFNAVSAMGGYYVQPSDFGNIIIESSGGYSLILDFSTYSFPSGVELLVFNANGSNLSVVGFGGPSVYGSPIPAGCWGRIVVNNATNSIYYS